MFSISRNAKSFDTEMKFLLLLSSCDMLFARVFSRQHFACREDTEGIRLSLQSHLHVVKLLLLNIQAEDLEHKTTAQALCPCGSDR